MECPRAFSGNLCTITLFFCVKDRPAFNCHRALIPTQVPFHLFFYMDPLTYYGGPGCYLRVSNIPHGEDVTTFTTAWSRCKIAILG